MCVCEGMHQVILTAGQEGRAQVQSVLLLTDGLVNRGIKSKDGILGEMRKLQSPPAGRHSKKVSRLGGRAKGRRGEKRKGQSEGGEEGRRGKRRGRGG